MKQQLLLQPCTNPSTPSGYNQIYMTLSSLSSPSFATEISNTLQQCGPCRLLTSAMKFDEGFPAVEIWASATARLSYIYLYIYIYVEHCRIWYCTCLFIVFLWLWSTKKIFPILGFLTTCGQLQNLQVVSVSVEVPNSLRKEPLPQLLDTRSLGCEVQGG